MTAPQLFDTTGMDQTTLSHAALLLSQNLAAGTPTNVTGPYASQLMQMAGASMNAQGNVISADPSFLQNVGSAVDSHLWGPTTTQLKQASTNVDNSSFSSWIETHTANFSLIAFGAVIAVAALIYSQRDNITTVVKQGAKIAALAA